MYFDASRYLRPPQIGAAGGFILALRLLRAAPKQPSERAHAALARMRTRGEKLQEVLRERARLQSFSLRPLDQNFDGCWAGFHMRLAAHARKPGSPHGVRAKTLLSDLFPAGLSFLGMAYEEQWLHSNTLLDRIKAEKLEQELDDLAGGTFFQDVLDAHAAFGEALGVGKSEPEEVPSLLDAVTALAHAIGDYGRVLAGEIEGQDPQSVVRFQTAMKPRDQHMARRSTPQGASEGEGDGDGENVLDTELPELPPLLDEAAAE